MNFYHWLIATFVCVAQSENPLISPGNGATQQKFTFNDRSSYFDFSNGFLDVNQLDG
jgi:hypothetical protein